MAHNPNVALLFFWKELERQVRIEGSVEKVSAEESDNYFDSRPEGSKIGAWVSPQSRVIRSRESLEKEMEAHGLIHILQNCLLFATQTN
jgi:pyridoxamine 5'-phosphate oxidase